MNDRKHSSLSRPLGLILACAIIIGFSGLGIALHWHDAEIRQYLVAKDTETLQEEQPEAAPYVIDIALANFTLSVWQTVFSAAGLAAVTLTVFYAHRAWQEARRSADAAQAALEDARSENEAQSVRFSEQLSIATDAAQAARKSADSFMAAERAYLFCHDVVRVQKDGDAHFELVWRNFGKTPAFVTAIRVDCKPHDAFPNPLIAPELPIPMGTVVGADEVWKRGVAARESEILPLLRSGLHVYLYGQISYVDIHGQRRRSWFCRLYTGNGFILGLLYQPELNGYE